MGRAPCCDKTKVKRGPWSPEEDTILKNYLEKNGTGSNWIALPSKAGLRRCGKSCRLRWLNYLRPDIKHGGFSEEEDHIILTLYSTIGSRWSVIASHLPGRTDNDVKNYWNTKLKKKILGVETAGLNAISTSATFNNNYNISPITSMHFSSTPFHSGNHANFYSNLSTLPYQTNMDHQQNSVEKLPLSGPVRHPLPGFLEVQENGSSTAYCSLSIVSSSQELSSNSPSFSLEKTITQVPSWPIDESGEDDGFLMELGSGFPCELLNGFAFQEKITETAPTSVNYSSYANLMANTSGSTDPLQEFY